MASLIPVLGGDNIDAVLIGGIREGATADVNGDCMPIGILDINTVSANWGTMGLPGFVTGDANYDGAVDIFDINYIGANWGVDPCLPGEDPVGGGGGSSQVPEPTALMLGLVAMILGLVRVRARVVSRAK